MQQSVDDTDRHVMRLACSKSTEVEVEDTITKADISYFFFTTYTISFLVFFKIHIIFHKPGDM